jgi:hypothetical protein
VFWHRGAAKAGLTEAVAMRAASMPPARYRAGFRIVWFAFSSKYRLNLPYAPAGSRTIAEMR